MNLGTAKEDIMELAPHTPAEVCMHHRGTEKDKDLYAFRLRGVRRWRASIPSDIGSWMLLCGAYRQTWKKREEPPR